MRKKNQNQIMKILDENELNNENKQIIQNAFFFLFFLLDSFEVD